MSELFPAGTFSNPSAPATRAAMLRSQTKMEVSLFVRNGEQLLLALFIPAALLFGLTMFGGDAIPDPRVDHAVMTVFAVAIMSSAFTGQAIAVGFDRRYGALKRLGGTPLPRSIIVGGKVAAVLVLVLGQLVILGIIAALLGWRPSLGGLLLALIPVILGVTAFCSLGLLLGGTLKAEITLGLANLIWFVLLGFAGLATGIVEVSDSVHNVLLLVPSYALTAGIGESLAGSMPAMELIVLAAWSLLGVTAASRFFSFT